jgi:hypothetical protein
MGAQRAERREAPPRRGGARPGALRPRALRLQAPMRPRGFTRDGPGPAPDHPGPARRRGLVQGGRPPGRRRPTLGGRAPAPPAAPPGRLASVRPPGGSGGHGHLAGGVARPRRTGALTPRRGCLGSPRLPGRTPLACQPGATAGPRCTCRGWSRAGGLAPPPRAQTGAGPCPARLEPCQDGITAVRPNDQGASRPPAALRRVDACRGTPDGPPRPRPDAPRPGHRGQEPPTAPAPATPLHTRRVGGAPRSTSAPCRAPVSAAPARAGVIPTTDDDTPRDDHGHAPPPPPPTGRQRRPHGSRQDAMRAWHGGCCAAPQHAAHGGHGPPSRRQARAHAEHCDRRPHRVRHHRGQDGHHPAPRRRPRAPRLPCVAEPCAAVTASLCFLKSHVWPKSSSEGV